MKIHMLAAATLAMLAAAGIHAAPPEQAPHARVLQLDSNSGGVIDRTEAAASTRLAARFDDLDAKGDGRLQRGELRGARKGHGPRGGHRGGHRHAGIDALARLDTDGDGRISRGELEAANAAREARAGADPKRAARTGHRARPDLLAQFDAIDRNRDSLLSRGELRSWSEAQRPQREAEMQRRFDERFGVADLNGDGRLSRVEVDEKMPRIASRFAWLDENGDGVLERNELRPQRGR